MKAWAMVALSLAALLGSCELSHTGSSSSSGSNWLRCAKLDDCRSSDKAVACSGDGYCEDAEGERIALLRTGSDTPEPPANACVWGVDALLAEVGVTTPERRNCGSLAPWSAPEQELLECLYEGTTAEFTLNRCIDCAILTTYVTTNFKSYAVLMDNDGVMDNDLSTREISVSECRGRVVMNASETDVECADPVELYRCSEPKSIERVYEAPKPRTPRKLADLAEPSADTEELHVYVSVNENVDRPLTNIDVFIDGVQVIWGGFAPGWHQWHQFDLVVPRGAHTLKAGASPGSVSLEEAFETPGQRWILLEYTYSESDDRGEFFQLSVLDRPPAFG